MPDSRWMGPPAFRTEGGLNRLGWVDEGPIDGHPSPNLLTVKSVRDRDRACKLYRLYKRYETHETHEAYDPYKAYAVRRIWDAGVGLLDVGPRAFLVLLARLHNTFDRSFGYPKEVRDLAVGVAGFPQPTDLSDLVWIELRSGSATHVRMPRNHL